MWDWWQNVSVWLFSQNLRAIASDYYKGLKAMVRFRIIYMLKFYTTSKVSGEDQFSYFG